MYCMYIYHYVVVWGCTIAHNHCPPNALPSTSAMCACMLQEWEQYASSQVSLSREMQQLVELILRWRKLELE